MSRYVPLPHPWIDASKAPVYEIRFPRTATDDDVRGFATARETWAKVAHHPVSWVVDMSALTSVPASQRRLFAEHLTRFEPHDIEFNRGSALVLPNAFLRGIATAVFWVVTPKFPHRAFETVEDARLWAQERVRPGSVHPPPSDA